MKPPKISRRHLVKRHFFLLLFAVTSILLSAQAQVSAGSATGVTAYPHRGHPHAEADIAGTSLPPFETPASLACVYRLARPLVPGCPVLGTSAVPTGGSGLIAIVNAFDNPPALADLNRFSGRFGLPECSGSNRCFRKAYATGVKPPPDGLWAQSASVVTEYAHAFAPQAQIVLVEAASSAIEDMWVAVRAANTILQNHGGGQMILPFSILEEADETSFDSNFTAPGVVYISGNEGSLGIFDYPATSPNVIALGGTGFVRDANGNFVREEATTFWAGGRSVYESRPSYQDGIEGKVRNSRGIPDAAFAGDPISGAILYYTSVSFDGFVGWIYEGNVGVGEAGWAGIINRANSHASSTQDELGMFYGSIGDATVFRDITKGQAFGISAGPGWDFLTGAGTGVGLKGK
jgi:subtilase family serine protease